MEKEAKALQTLRLDIEATLSPQPSTLNPQPSTLNPQPSTLNPQSSTLTPKMSKWQERERNLERIEREVPPQLYPRLRIQGHP